MKPLMKAALLLDFLGLSTVLACFTKTTPITMSLFFFVGLPAFLAGMACYVLTLPSRAIFLGKAGDEK